MSPSTLMSWGRCDVWRKTWRFVSLQTSCLTSLLCAVLRPKVTWIFWVDQIFVSWLTGQLIVYYTESWSTALYSAERCAMTHDRDTCLEGDMKICFPPMWRSSLDQSYFFIHLINYMRYNKCIIQTIVNGGLLYHHLSSRHPTKCKHAETTVPQKGHNLKIGQKYTFTSDTVTQNN